jgi:O-succinylbenzoic acid--CoA ligase
VERAELAARLGGQKTAGPRLRHPDPVLLTEAAPGRFMAAFAAAAAGEAEVFLCNPQWGEQELEQLEQHLPKPYTSSHPFPSPRGWLMIPTGGSSGQLKFARHDGETLVAAVRGFTQHFAIPRVNAVGLLPLHHVSGLMAWLRCALTGGDYLPGDWKRIEAGDFPALPAKAEGWVVSLVPTQLERLLRNAAAVAWLGQFRIIFIGGAPAWPELLNRAAAARLPLSLGYGMTETAAMTTALRPGEFLGGARDSGTALPHARVAVNHEGMVMVTSSSLFRGYYPYWGGGPVFTTGDLGRVSERGHLTVLGRRDGLIISGGEKIQPLEVEAVLRTTGGFADVAVLGVPDPEWGQVIVAAFPAAPAPDLAHAKEAIASQLAAHKRPKHYVPLTEWPRTAAGKLDRAQLARMVEKQLKS